MQLAEVYKECPQQRSLCCCSGVCVCVGGGGTGVPPGALGAKK
jgi:hypothetical protein